MDDYRSVFTAETSRYLLRKAVTQVIHGTEQKPPQSIHGLENTDLCVEPLLRQNGAWAEAARLRR